MRLYNKTDREVVFGSKAEAVTTTNHVAIRIDEDDGASSSCCAVCMEPSDWVIVGACGHREVCLYCAVRMRFFQDDRRCCICRAFCATVVVITRANIGPQQVVDDGGSQRRQSVFSETSPVYDSIRPAGTHCWHYYHGGMAAYFDDRALYEAVRNMCSRPLPLPTGVGNKHHRAPQDPNADSKYFLRYLALVALVGAAGSIPLAMHYLKDWLPRVAVVIASGLLTTAWSYFHSRWYS